MSNIKKVVHPIAWMLFVIAITVTTLTNQAIAQEYEDPFVYNAPHERFCIVRAGVSALPPTIEDDFDIACMVDHYARNPNDSRFATESWEVINVLDIHVHVYPNPPANPTLDEQIAFVNQQITPIVNAYPDGMIYVLGNEVDRPSIPVNGVEVALQDDELPEDYAVIYHDMYEHIKSLDPTASVVPAGIVQPTDLRLEYLDKVLEAYQTFYGEPMPVDAWHVHNMILNEGAYPAWGAGIPPGSDATRGLVLALDQNDNMNLFRQQIVDFRQWMADNGYRDTPLVIYEYGILLPEIFGYPVDRVNAFMTATFDYMLTATDDEIGYPADGNRLVQQWAWYSLNDREYNPEPGSPPGFNGNLIDHDTGEWTETGDAFKEYIRADISVESVTAVQDGSNAVVDIELRNLGIEPVRDATLLVLITDDSGLSLQERVPIVDLFGGENPQQFQVTFNNALPGNQTITVFADSSSVVEEKSEVNNTAESSVEIMDIRPDITVGSVNPVPDDNEGIVTVDIELSNTGITSISNAAMLVTLTDENNIVVFEETVQIVDLVNGELRQFQVIFTDVPSGTHTITVMADSEALVAEVSEDNNSFDMPVQIVDPTSIMLTGMQTSFSLQNSAMMLLFVLLALSSVIVSRTD